MKTYQMVSSGDHITVGVSGGADSMALLHVLVRLREEWNLSLTVAHVNHGLRGEESDRDQAFVEAACQRWQVPCESVKEDMLAYSRAAGRGVEETSRGFRYAYFHKISHEKTGRPDGKVATAHTADDNAETVILNMTRGTGVTGLGGIPPTGTVIRPLIACSREMVEEYCREQTIDFVIDSTNWQDVYCRNRIRHHVIPLLKEQNPSFLKAITRMTQSNRRDGAFLLSLGEELLEQSKRENGYDIATLRRAQEVPLIYALKVWLQQSGVEESAYHLEKIKALIQKGYGSCSLAGTRQAQVSGGILQLVKREKTLAFSRKIPLETAAYWVCKKQIAITLEKEPMAQEFASYNTLDRDTIGTTLVLRNRREGDFITLPKRPRKSLKKLMNEQKIPVQERNKRLILADETGVLWVEGIGVDERCAATPATQNLLCVRVTEES